MAAGRVRHRTATHQSAWGGTHRSRKCAVGTSEEAAEEPWGTKFRTCKSDLVSSTTRRHRFDMLCSTTATGTCSNQETLLSLYLSSGGRTREARMCGPGRDAVWRRHAEQAHKGRCHAEQHKSCNGIPQFMQQELRALRDGRLYARRCVQ